MNEVGNKADALHQIEVEEGKAEGENHELHEFDAEKRKEKGETHELHQIEVMERKLQGENDAALMFLDSVDGFLTIMESLSSSLRQGWLDLSIARHSMGPSRINAALLSLKPHDALTSVLVCDDMSENSNDKQRFVLRKCGSLVESGSKSSVEFVNESSEAKLESQEFMCNNNSLPTDDRDTQNLSETVASLQLDEQVKKDQSKLLSTFGVLVSSKLCDAQRSFTSALDMIVEAANMRKRMMHNYDQVLEQS